MKGQLNTAASVWWHEGTAQYCCKCLVARRDSSVTQVNQIITILLQVFDGMKGQLSHSSQSNIHIATESVIKLLPLSRAVLLWCLYQWQVWKCLADKFADNAHCKRFSPPMRDIFMDG